MATNWPENRVSVRKTIESINGFLFRKESFVKEFGNESGDNREKRTIGDETIRSPEISTKCTNSTLVIVVLTLIFVCLIIAAIIICLLVFVFDELPFKSTFLGPCSAGVQCKSGIGLECINKTCLCDSNGYYWDGKKCTVLLKGGEVCDWGSYQCLRNLQCINKVCSCASIDFLVNNSCIQKFGFNSNCSSNAMCQDTIGLFCDLTSRKCLCASKTHYYDNILSICMLKVGYNSTCASNTECKPENLICTMSSSTSSCPHTLALNRCSCSIGFYFNGLNCVPLELYYGTCTSGCECNAARNLVCDTSIDRCVCSSNHYWNGTMCLVIKSYSLACSNANECDASKGLTCSSSICKCSLYAGNWYWASLYQTCLECPLGWTIFNSTSSAPHKQKCIKPFYTLLTWGQAKVNCEHNYARLIEPSEVDETFQLRALGILSASISWAGGQSFTNGIYLWSSSGSPITTFCSGEPTNNVLTENCNFIKYNLACMGDFPCDGTQIYTCQKL